MPIQEGKHNKGGVNQRPSSPRPRTRPSGQMILDGNSRPGQGKVYATPLEMKQAKEIEQLKQTLNNVNKTTQEAITRMTIIQAKWTRKHNDTLNHGTANLINSFRDDFAQVKTILDKLVEK